MLYPMDNDDAGRKASQKIGNMIAEITGKYPQYD